MAEQQSQGGDSLASLREGIQALPVSDQRSLLISELFRLAYGEGGIDPQLLEALNQLPVRHSGTEPVADIHTAGGPDDPYEAQDEDAAVEKSRLIEGIVADTSLIHGLAGKFNGYDTGISGFRDKDQNEWRSSDSPVREGKAATYRDYFWGNRRQLKVGDNEPPLPFQATVVKRSFAVSNQPPKISLCLTYLDPNSPQLNRPGVTTAYTVIFPEDSKHIEVIEEDPALIIDLMHRVFPEADRSNGQLELIPIPVQLWDNSAKDIYAQ